MRSRCYDSPVFPHLTESVREDETVYGVGQFSPFGQSLIVLGG